MDREAFIEAIKNKSGNGVVVSHEPGSCKMFLNKKKTFKIDIHLGLFDYNIGLFNPSAAIYRRTKYGGYREHAGISGSGVILDYIEQTALSWEEVEKEEDRFDKNQIIQNIVAREIINCIKKIDNKARIHKLATDAGDSCVITSWAFRICRIYQDRTNLEWKHPCNTSRGGDLKYNMLDPNFDPQLLIDTIVEFTKRLKDAANKMDKIWGECENKWHLEKRNAEVR